MINNNDSRAQQNADDQAGITYYSNNIGDILQLSWGKFYLSMLFRTISISITTSISM